MGEINLKRTVLAGTMAAAILLTAGCVDEPSPVGSSLLPPSDLVAVDSLVIPATKSYGEKAIPLPFSVSRTALALGDSGGFQAWTFLRFSGFPDSLNNATFVSADIHMESLYSIGDSTAPVPFTVLKAIGEWNRRTYVYDSLGAAGVFEPTGSSTAIGPSGEFPVDTAIVREWVRSISDTAYRNFGIVLKPQTGSVIRGFRSGAVDSAELRPTLKLRYFITDPGQEDTLVLTPSIDKFVAGMADTTLLRDSLLVPIRGGAAYRGVISFDVSTVPAHAAIHRAFLDLTFDAASSHLATGEKRSLLALYADAFNTVQAGELLAMEPAVYRFNVTEFVQAMVRGSDTSIRFSVEDEENSVGLFLMHGAAASNTTLRPKITVLYSPTR